MLKFAFEQEDGGISEENPEVAISSWPMRGNPQRSGLAEKIETEISELIRFSALEKSASQ